MKLGFIGTGKITVAVVTGICRSKISFKKILLSPRNKNVARKLKKKFKKVLSVKRGNILMGAFRRIVLKNRELKMAR